MGATRHLGEAIRITKSGSAEELAPGWFNRNNLGTDPGQGAAQTLGIVGFGRIGQALARKAHLAFGMDVIYFDNAPFIMHSETANAVDSLEELLGAADVVSIHTTLDEATHHMMNAQTFGAQLLPSAVG